MKMRELDGRPFLVTENLNRRVKADTRYLLRNWKSSRVENATQETMIQTNGASRCSGELATKVYVVIVQIKLISRETPKYTYQSCAQRIFSECICIVVVWKLHGSSVSERSCYSKQVISKYSKRLITIALDWFRPTNFPFYLSPFQSCSLSQLRGTLCILATMSSITLGVRTVETTRSTRREGKSMDRLSACPTRRCSIRCSDGAFCRSSTSWNQDNTDPGASTTASCWDRYGTWCNSLCSSVASRRRNRQTQLCRRETPPTTNSSSSRSALVSGVSRPIGSPREAINCPCAVWSVPRCRSEGSWISPSSWSSPHPSSSTCILKADRFWGRDY